MLTLCLNIVPFKHVLTVLDHSFCRYVGGKGFPGPTVYNLPSLLPQLATLGGGWKRASISDSPGMFGFISLVSQSHGVYLLPLLLGHTALLTARASLGIVFPTADSSLAGPLLLSVIVAELNHDFCFT